MGKGRKKGKYRGCQFEGKRERNEMFEGDLEAAVLEPKRGDCLLIHRR